MFESVHFTSKGRASTAASNPEVIAILREIVGVASDVAWDGFVAALGWSSAF